MKIFALAITLAALVLPLAAQSTDQPSQERRDQLLSEPSPSPAQSPKKTPVKATAPKSRTKAQRPAAKGDNAAFEAAAAIENPTEKLAALKKFVEEFPESTHIDAAREAIVSTAISLGDERLLAGDAAAAVELYKTAINSTDQPVPDALFNDTLSKIPNSLYWRGYRTEGLDIAHALATRIDKNASQLATLATFYIGIENGEEAARIAEMAVAVDPNSSDAYQTLGLARRVNFQLEESAAAYAKALELRPDSAAAKRSLADMKRALGHSDEALQLYRDLVTADASDAQSRTGLVLTLFDAGKRADAEAEMNAALDQNPNNIVLLAGAAYWYAANNDGDKAVELGRKAVSIEPRYVWSHIALARGLMAQNRPVDAEEALLRARQYGRFPTVDYEIAAARYKAGFYREAAEELEKSFTTSGDSVQTRLGGRVQQNNSSFIELLANERRASILEPMAADDEATAAGLKALLEFQSKLKGGSPAEIAAAADGFAAGDDKMKLHRQLYAASVLLDKKVAPEKAFELTQSAIGNTDAALEVPTAAAAVMASELYDSRAAAVERNEFLRVPDVPRQTLSAILRGRVEELAGRALMQREDPTEAVVRLRRAVSVMPPKSAWWRSSMWQLGDALRAEGNEKESLDSYIKSYSIDKPDLVRYTTIETLYKKLNGSTEGLEAKIGPGPLPGISPENVARKVEPAPTPEETPAPTPSFTSSPAPVRLPRALPVASPAPQPAAPAVSETPAAASPAALPATVVTAEPSPSPVVESSPVGIPAPTPEATPVPTPEQTPEPAPSPTPEVNASPSPEPTAAATPEPTPIPEPSATPTPEPVVERTAPEPSPSVTPAATPEPEATVRPTPEPTATPEPPGEPAATPMPTPVPASTPTIENVSTVAQNIPPTTEQPPTPSPEPSPSQASEKVTAQPEPTGQPLFGPARSASGAGRPKVVVTENISPGRSAAPANSSPTAANSPPAARGLFDPIVIGVPGAGARKSEPKREDAKQPDTAPQEQPAPESQPVKEPSRSARVEITDTLLPVAPPSREVRPRVTRETEPAPVARCSVTTSDERLTLMKNGGSLGLLVGVGSPGSLNEVKATPNSPEDIQVTREAPIAGLEDRAVFSIKAVSSKPGIYNIVFEAPCGRHQITVNVR